MITDNGISINGMNIIIPQAENVIYIIIYIDDKHLFFFDS